MAELDGNVVAAARAGDPDAVGTIYTVLSPKVLGYLRSRGVEDAEGLTSEVFLQVIPRLPRLQGGAAELRTFVFSVAHARAVDDVRRRSRRPDPFPYEPDLDDRATGSAEATALADPCSRDMQDLLGRLREDQRTVITLRVLGDLSLEQTAAVLGRSTGAVKQLQRRGLLALRALMERGEVAL